MKNDITPKSLILGLLQASKVGQVSVKSLISVGEMFGFTGNTIRVTATRLIREGKLESDERGLYRLSDQIDPFSKFVESWRTGENRLVPWDGSWMCYLAPPITARLQAKNKKTLHRPGFRKGRLNLWIRPNNLKIGIHGIGKIITQLGIIEKGELFVGRDFDEKLIEQWKKYLWPIEELAKAQQDCVIKMEKSAERIFKMPLNNALVESYLMGHEAIILLITDPLLPKELMDSTHRIALTQAMLEYDVLGKIIWRDRFGEIDTEKTPPYIIGANNF